MIKVNPYTRMPYSKKYWKILEKHDRAASLLKMDLVPLRELGQFIGSTENGTEYQLDQVLTLLPPIQRQLLAVRRKANAHSRPPLQDGSRIVASHLTKIWNVAERLPFKAVNLNDFMERWKAGPRNSEGDQRACEPPDAIRAYSCRQSGNAGRNPHLKDLPEYIVEALLGGGSNSGKPTRTVSIQPPQVLQQRVVSGVPGVHRESAVSWGEVRQWTMVSDKLVPRQKRRRIFEEVGNRSQDSQGSHVGMSEGISVASVEL
ncbi:unnamed protein product [Heligmosomoides polygyrus]|uniref:Uncharacterized protein n=1 Tax=Heligmosomoides polygyrus TaxID=6339 RepID=A0A183FE28_HELPZ|nr:unnamed protein product [Heligmosomoides polygyrus]